MIVTNALITRKQAHDGGDLAMRIASFNVENLFERAKALNLESWTPGKPILAAQAADRRRRPPGTTGSEGRNG
jgi:hypothetical protein